MNVGDLVVWSQSYSDTPGLVLEKKPSVELSSDESAYSPMGWAVLAMLPEYDFEPEWFHEYELEVISESR